MSDFLADFLSFLSLDFFGFVSPDLEPTSCTAGVSTGPVSRAAGAIKGESDNTTLELGGFTAALGVENTFPLLQNVQIVQPIYRSSRKTVRL